MAMDLTDCQFHGPALPEPFVKFELEKELSRLKLVPKATGDEGRHLREAWNSYRRNLLGLAGGGPIRVRNQVIDPILALLGYARIENAPDVQTREDFEAGGTFLVSDDASKRLRMWATQYNEDLYAPAKRGRAYRFSHLRIAQRVLLAAGERVGLLTNGVQLLILISDPARPDSTVSIPLDGGWKRSREIPDSFKFFLAMSSPRGVEAMPDLVEKARLQQTRVTKELRIQARQAIQFFVQEVMAQPANAEAFASPTDREALAKALWREGLVIVYRLLFILKLESSDDPARSFSFASTSLWRNTFSPSLTLARYAREVLENGTETGRLLEDGLRGLFRMFEDGVECTELVVKPLGGALFGSNATPTLSNLVWGERAVAWLFDQLLWTPKRRGSVARERVHYGPLDVEDLGRVYEALLELEPGITSEPMCRLRRQKLEVVVPIAQGEKYRTAGAGEADNSEDADADDSESDEDDAPTTGKKTKVQWIEEIPPRRFYLRVGLGRKASGSYYTPHSFVRFLVQETLGPQVAERSPEDDPKPSEILKLKVLDPAMGSGHFLVEACRFLGEKLYEACRLCDEKALEAERKAEKLKDSAKVLAVEEAQQWRKRILDLPDPTAELPKYLPSRSPEGEQSGYSQKKAEALCRRLVATHCLYGVDKNPLAVELAKLSLWLESHAEGMPLTFLDHRLVKGDSLTGPFWEKLLCYPGKPKEAIENLFHQNLLTNFTKALGRAIRNVRDLEANVGITLAEIEDKKRLKAEMDCALLPFRVAAAAWSGGVMLGPEKCDDMAYADLLQTIAQTGDLPGHIESELLRNAIAKGFGAEEIPPEREELYEAIASNGLVPALPYDLTFPEVFYPNGIPHGRRGFHAALGNPPWERIEIDPVDFFAQIDFGVIEETREIRDQLISELKMAPRLHTPWERICSQTEQEMRITDCLYSYQTVEVDGRKTVGRPDSYRLFLERFLQLVRSGGSVSWVVPSSYHSNEGAAGVRRLYHTETGLRFCFSFENKKKFFEIDSRQKYCLALADKTSAGSHEFKAAFYLHDPEWLFSDNRSDREVTLDRETIILTGGPHQTYIEVRTQPDLELIVAQLRSQRHSWSEFLTSLGIVTAFGVELHRNPLFDKRLPRTQKVADLFSSAESENWKWLPIHAGKTIFQFQDQWDAYCTHYVSSRDAFATRHWRDSVGYYRLAFRRVARSTDERTMISVVVTPGFVCEQTLAVETSPRNRPNARALLTLAFANTYCFDWQVRQRVTTGLSNYILSPIPIPDLDPANAFLCHSALRLTCNHAGYEPLWHDQVGDVWREPNKKPFTWPVLAGDEERWEVRAAIDAVVADAYSLSRSQYEHILSTFSHTSYPKAPHLCLAKFDELKTIGLEAFSMKYDPYCDIPLNENLPQPVIDLPIPEEPIEGETGSLFGEPATRKSKRSRRKK